MRYLRGFSFTALFLISVLASAQRPVPAQPVLVTFETELGKITMEVDVLHAPITGDNFLKYVDGGFYNGGIINRAVRPDNTTRHDVEIQVIQFQINPERNADQFPPIPMERTSVTGLKHVNGALSMARNGPDTARASFSIVIGDQPEMDFGGKRNADGQGFAAFGRVVEGMDVVKKVQSAHTLPAGQRGAYGTETLDPPIKILKAYQGKSATSGKAGGVHGEPLKAVSARRASVCAVALSLENL
jgi:peptidyl-prolyl cis-trans isomerase A (cyclophilin A)